MNNVNLKYLIYALVAISAVVWFILAHLQGSDLSVAINFFSFLPKVVTIDLFFIGVFVKWGWKLKVFKHWLVKFPNLKGTWIGEIHSNWINPETKEKSPPIPVMLTINQSFSHISCVMHTKEMNSYSTAEGFNIDVDRQLRQLSYIYTSKPRNKFDNRSLPHDGAIVFNIITSTNKLVGRYWTERRTHGEIHLRFFNKKLLEELPSDLGKHPVSENVKQG